MSLLRGLFPVLTGARPDAQDGTAEEARARASAGGGTEEFDELVAEAFAHYAAHRFAEALRFVNRAIAARPGAPNMLYGRASILFAWGRFREALTAYERARAAGVEHAELYVYMGQAYSATGDTKQAELCFRKAVALEPDGWEGHYRLAALLHAHQRPKEAVGELQRALELSPDCLDCYAALGNCAIDRKDPVVAEGFFRRVLDTDDQSPEAWGNLGVALDRQQRFEEAQAAFEQAECLESKGSEVDSYYNVGIALADSGRVDEALALSEANLADRPGVLAYSAYALTLLAAGKLGEGWNLHEFRWLLERYVFSRPRFERPQWDGQDLRGKTILLLSEQGLGDTIHFLRYAPCVKATGATVLLRIQGGQQELVRAAPGVDRVIGREGGHHAFDTYAHLMSLPRIFGTELESIPAQVPYLHPDPAAVERWAARIHAGAKLRVGLVWAGNPAHMRDQYRSVSLKALAPILSVKGVRFFFLQKGPAAAEATLVDPDVDAVNLAPELNHLGDTAAVISHLDLLICVDTSVAHLGGALGKPVWVLLPTPADWRWLLEREDSPWYPTVRLFRQSRRNQWADVIARAQSALCELVEKRASPAGLRHEPPPAMPKPSEPLLPRLRPGHRPGFCAVAECRHGIFQYFPDTPWIGDSLGWYGDYLQSQVDVLLRLLRPGAAVLEAGAGIGVHALPLARGIDQEGHLLVYESRLPVRRVLKHNLSANGVQNVTVMRRQLRCEPGAGNETGKQPRITADPKSSGDDFFETIDDLQLEQLHLLKINESVDAMTVIDGAAETLWRLRPLLFVAAHDERALANFAMRARDYGCRCWKMETPLFNPDNFNRRDKDIFAGRKALALLAIPEEAKADIAFDGCTEL